MGQPFGLEQRCRHQSLRPHLGGNRYRPPPCLRRMRWCSFPWQEKPAGLASQMQYLEEVVLTGTARSASEK